MTLLAVATLGGHWTQLLRMTKELERHHSVTYVSTNADCAKMVGDNDFYVIDDFSRWNPARIIPAYFHAKKIIKKVSPDAVITTGAAPGLMVLMAARMAGIKTIWVDSIANAESLSMSGKIASHFASTTFTQWESLATGKVKYAGNVLGD